MTEDKKYNGWANYETWRVNLEIFDGREWERGEIDRDLSDVAKMLKEQAEEAEEAVGGYGSIPEDSLAYSYAMSFLGEVDWYEIARAIREDNEIEEDTEIGK